MTFNDKVAWLVSLTASGLYFAGVVWFKQFSLGMMQ